ncbi:MAG: sensor histidine kinase [Saccharofermentanales bacterium]
MTRRLTRPINNFVTKMSSLDIENLREPFDYNSQDYETEILNRSFKEMKGRLIESLSRQNALEAIQTKTLFNILQSEIGPHFLFNSLGSIANMCESGESKEAADACYSLSEILRYAADYEASIVTVKEEADSLNAYLAIMKSRYRQRVDFETSISDSAKVFLTPKLTFQPLVENAIKYSLTENESVHVRISAQATGNLLTITVSDNGIGLSEEKKKEISEILSIDEISLENTEIKKRIKFGGMGLVGTLMRILLFAGKGFTYTLEDNIPSGSIITIRIDTSESAAADNAGGIR